MKMIMIILLINSLMFSLASHPLTMGFHLIMQTILTSMIINIMMKTTWFSFIVVIILLGGMLVLFIYMASIASNEKFNMSIKIIPMIIIMLMITTMLMIMSQEMTTPYNFNDIMMNNNVIMLNKMFNTKNATITIMMMIYLMFTMISINNIVKTNEGPLRKKS